MNQQAEDVRPESRADMPWPAEKLLLGMNKV